MFGSQSAPVSTGRSDKQRVSGWNQFCMTRATSQELPIALQLEFNPLPIQYQPPFLQPSSWWAEWSKWADGTPVSCLQGPGRPWNQIPSTMRSLCFSRVPDKSSPQYWSVLALLSGEKAIMHCTDSPYCVSLFPHSSTGFNLICKCEISECVLFWCHI
jgi:hypothetical protein